jgi:hypothetical protein
MQTRANALTCFFGRRQVACAATRPVPLPSRPMNDLIRPNFGLLIAYILPGFVVVSGAALLYPSVRSLLMPTLGLADGVESTVFVGLATLLAGMSVSALRWLLVDTFHHWTGLRRPEWDDASLPAKLPAFAAIVDDHYRFYQFHANLAVAVACVYIAWRIQQPPFAPWADEAFLLVELLFLATSRDNLRKYYARASRLLGPPLPLGHRKERAGCQTAAIRRNPRAKSPRRRSRPAAKSRRRSRHSRVAR